MYRLGLGGLISPRTRVTSGYGFQIQEFEEYELHGTEINGEVMVKTVGGQHCNNLKYTFGDMTKAALSTLKAANAKVLALSKQLEGEVMFEAGEYRRWEAEWRESRGGSRSHRNTTGDSNSNEGGSDRQSSSIMGFAPVASTHPSSLAKPPEENLWALFFAAVSFTGYWTSLNCPCCCCWVLGVGIL